MVKPTEGKKRAALGLGLGALIPIDEPTPQIDAGVTQVSLDALKPNAYQPRRIFSEDSLEDLRNSIAEIGVIQPIIVRPLEVGFYEIVAGERRWRAARMAGLPVVPVLVRNVSDAESLEIALIENLQRENLNPLETAEAYDILIKKFSYTHETLAQRMGKDRSSVTNYLRLLKLPEEIKENLLDDKLSMGHARTLLAIEHEPTLLNMGRRVVRRKLSVRELEKIVQNFKKRQEQAGEPPLKTPVPERPPVEKELAQFLNTKVEVSRKPDASGKIVIHFASEEELTRLVELMERLK